MTDSFETKFSILADAQINDKIPALKKHMIGFQVVASEEDNSKAVGVLAYNIGKRLVYVPIFWLNGKVKGGDVMYLKDEDRFLPLGEIWVNFINTGKSFAIGEAGNATEDQKGSANRVSTMDLNWLYSKRAGEVGIIDATDVVKMSAQVSCPEISLAKHLGMFTKEAADALAKTITKSADFANSLFRYYTPNELFNIIGGRLKTASDKSAKTSKIRFYTDKYSKQAADLTMAEKQELVNDGIVVRDEREDNSHLYKMRSSNNKYASPTTSGRYQILTSAYELVPRTVILVNNTLDNCDCWRCRSKRTSVKAVVIDSDKKTYTEVSPSELMAIKDDSSDEASKTETRIGSLVTESKLRELATVPADNTRSPYSDVGGFSREVIFYSKNSGNGVRGSLKVGSTGAVVFTTSECAAPSRVIVMTNNDGKLGLTSPTSIFLPKDTRVIDLSNYKRDWSGDSQYTISFGLTAPFIPESVGLNSLKIASDGIRYSISSVKTNRDSLNFVDAVKTLVGIEGIGAKQAKDILRDAKASASDTHRYHQISCVIKYADDISDPQEVYGDDHTLTKEIFSTPGLSNREIQSINEAAKKGVKEVLDTKILAELAKSAYPLDKAVDYLPIFMKSIDKLGRLLFLFYWHNDSFEERYGKQNLAQIEDSLKDNLQSLGDLVIYLKEKDISSDESLGLDDKGDDLTKDLV